MSLAFSNRSLYRRSLSLNRAWVCLRSVLSATKHTTPLTWPHASRSSARHTLTSTIEPSLRRAWRSSPRGTSSRITGGVAPSTSASVQPKSFAAPGFQDWTLPSRSRVTTARGDCRITVSSLELAAARAASARFRPVTSSTVPS